MKKLLNLSIEEFQKDFQASFKVVLDSLGFSPEIVHTSKFHGESYLEHCELVFRAMMKRTSQEESLWLAILHDIAKPICADGKGSFPMHGPKGGDLCEKLGFGELKHLVHYHLSVLFELKGSKAKEMSSHLSKDDLEIMEHLIYADREGSICPSDVSLEDFEKAGNGSIEMFLKNKELLNSLRES